MNNDFFVHETAVVDFPCQIGKNTKIWHFTHLMSHCQIGDDCILGQNVFVASEVVVGNRVKIQNNVSLFAGVTCEDEVFIGPSVVFTNVLNPRSAVNRKNEFRATKIGKGATIGANSTIICGLQIGKYAFVGAGSVVTHDVPDYAMVLGNPARRVGWMSENGQKLSFDKDGFACCPVTGEKYQLSNNQVVKL